MTAATATATGVGRGSWGEIRSRHRLGDVARRSGLEIPATGRVMVCCPTPGHDDRHPSMQLDLDRDRYWCFGCASHGDVIDWVKDIEGVDTAAAIAILDSGRAINAALSSPTGRPVTAGPLRDAPRPDRTHPSTVVAANNLAWRYYSSPALHQRGTDYLAERGVDVTCLEAELAAPVVGHTPSARTRIDGLARYLARHGFTADELVDAGLATRFADGCVIDFHRDRAILPIKDAAGAITALVGRDISGHQPKYLNPPATAAYHKGRALYRPATGPLDPQASVVVCEGPIDALAIAAAAATTGLSTYYAPVAACGRSLTDPQLDAIAAIHPKPAVLAADGDRPGRQANLDWAARILALGRETVIVTWPDGHDPSSWLADRGPPGLRAVTRLGCLEDRSGVLRPRHCATVLTQAAFPDHDSYFRPDPQTLSGYLQQATARLEPAARQRYLAAAASLFELDPACLARLADNGHVPPRPSARAHPRAASPIERTHP